MRRIRLLQWLVVIVATLALSTAATAAPQTDLRPNFHLQAATLIDFSQGECCLYWYFGKPTAVTAPRVGSATLTTFFIQCFSLSFCNPQNSQLTVTFETKDGDKLVFLGYAPDLGTSTVIVGGYRIAVAGTWTVEPTSTGRFASYTGSGTFSFVLTQPFGSVGGSERMSLVGSLTPT